MSRRNVRKYLLTTRTGQLTSTLYEQLISGMLYQRIVWKPSPSTTLWPDSTKNFSQVKTQQVQGQQAGHKELDLTTPSTLMGKYTSGYHFGQVTACIQSAKHMAEGNRHILLLNICSDFSTSYNMAVQGKRRRGNRPVVEEQADKHETRRSLAPSLGLYSFRM